MGQEGAEDNGKLLTQYWWWVAEDITHVALAYINFSSIHFPAGSCYFLRRHLTYFTLRSTVQHTFHLHFQFLHSRRCAELYSAEFPIR